MQTKRVTVTVALLSIALLGDKCAGICDRSSRIREILVDQAKENDPNVEDCKDVTATHLTKITEIRDNRIDKLDPGDLSGLSNLEVFRLDGCSLATLKDDVFKDQKKLEHLAHFDGRLAKIDTDAFAGLDELVTMDFEESYDLTISVDVFEGKVPKLKCLNLIDISDKQDPQETEKIRKHFADRGGAFYLRLVQDDPTCPY